MNNKLWLEELALWKFQCPGQELGFVFFYYILNSRANLVHSALGTGEWKTQTSQTPYYAKIYKVNGNIHKTK